MIRIIGGSERTRNQHELEAMFRLRKRVFHDLLGWDVSVRGDMEIDRFDDANPLYVLSCSQTTGRLRGALRLLPTLGPNMLDDAFPALLGGGPLIRSASAWESSRFCIDPDASQSRASNQVTEAAAELMCGVGEIGLASGIECIVTVTDVLLERMFRRMGCPGERIGVPQRIGRVNTVAISWQVTPALLARMKQIAGIPGNVLEQPFTLETPRAA